MSIQYKPASKTIEAMYDNWAEGLRDNYKNHSFRNAKEFETQLSKMDKEWAAEGEP